MIRLNMNLCPSYKFLKRCFIRITKAVLTLVCAIKLFTSIKVVFLVQNNSVLMYSLKKQKKIVLIYTLLQSSKPVLRGDVTGTTFFSSMRIIFLLTPHHGYNYFTKYSLPFLETIFHSTFLLTQTTSSGQIMNENRTWEQALFVACCFC